MVDQIARKQYCQLIRHFASGRITNFDYDDKTSDLCDDADDAGISFIYWALWGLYDDTYLHFLTGRHRLERRTRTKVARCVLFLQSDAKYEAKKPPRRPLLRRLLSWLTLGMMGEDSAVLKECDDDTWYEETVWPFASRQELRASLRNPKLLCDRNKALPTAVNKALEL